MTQDDSLTLVLRDFARTMLTDFDIQRILDVLIERIVTVLPITGAGVTLITEDLAPRYVAASDEAALRFEQLQTSLGQGPCLTAYATGQPVALADLTLDEQYPEFAPAAVADGLAAAFTFPLHHGEQRLGALDLYRSSPGTLPPWAWEAAQTLADVASAYLLNAEARVRAQTAADAFRDQSLHDALTGLPNRLLLQERLEHAAHRASRSHSAAAVLFVDLDRFKRVNDTYGHAAGDDLLRSVAQRLSALLRPGDTLARVSGDEFVVLCEDLATARDAELVADRITQAFAAPFELLTMTVAVTASVGVAYAGPGEVVSARLVSDADSAMYRAKDRGGATHHVLDGGSGSTGFALEQELRTATSRSELDLAYQPIVRTASGELVGVEALLRWTHPELGAVPAAATVAMAERTGFIGEVGAWVLERSCRARARWLADHPDRPLQLAVNVSPSQVLDAGYARRVATTLDRSGTDPSALTLEVTEGIFLSESDRTRRVFAELRALGVRLALDDFGTGFSSLNYLRRFPVDVIKIDQSFIADLGRDPTAATVVTATIALAHGLGMTVIAEGVQTEQQRDVLAELGCRLAQGHLYARPMTELDLRDTIARAGAGVAVAG